MILSSTWRKIWLLVAPYSHRVVLAIIFGLIVSGVDGAIAWMIKPIMDYLFVEGRYEYILFLPIGIFSLYLVRGASDCVQAYLMGTAGLKLVRDLRSKFFETLINLPISSISRSSSGDLISRQLNDIGLLSCILSDSFSTFLVQIPTIVVLIFVALFRRWDLAILSFLLYPVIAIGTKKFGTQVRDKRLDAQAHLSSLTHLMNEAFIGLRIIKIYGLERFKIDRFRGENQNTYRANAKVIIFRQWTRFFIDIVSGLSVAVVIGYGSYLVAKAEITSGDLFSVLVAIGMIFSPLKRVGTAYNILQESLGVMERIDVFMHSAPEDKAGIKISGLRYGIELKDVEFLYNSENNVILSGINLYIPHGKALGIVGPSGSGKSTLLDLLQRFYIPTRGAILWDGIDIKSADLTSLRKQIGIVSQDVILFRGTIRENIAVGKATAKAVDIENAAMVANAHDFIMSLPQGYETLLEERGLNLSGGQRQRIALARAVLKNPPLLILDEATSALDTVSEQAVQQAMANVMKNRTTIVVAHRLSTIQNADMIIVMDRGRIVATGTHQELLGQSKLYQELYSGSSGKTAACLHV